MISVAEALTRILALIEPTGPQMAPLTEACDRVLAADVSARRAQPPFAASAMDGYAARAADLVAGAALRVIGEAPAGRPFAGAVGAGETVRIFTGAPVPRGADAVIIQEDVTREEETIRIGETVGPGANIRPAGLDFAAGETRLRAPRRLSPQDIALAAAMNAPFLTVHRKPRIALLATGDELVLPGAAPGTGQIVSSNNFGIAALLTRHGADPILAPIAPDDAEGLRAAARDMRGADLIVTLGGASVGDHDLIRSALPDAGLEVDFFKVAMRPGKPLLAGRIGGAPMIGLPGNPVSAMVCAHLFLRPALDALLGLPATAPARQMAVLTAPTPPNGPRAHYMRADLRRDGDVLLCAPFKNQDSSVLTLLAEADALAVTPAHDPGRAPGDLVEVILI